MDNRRGVEDMNVFLLDDDICFVNDFKKWLDDYNKDIHLVINQDYLKRYDIYFLDIDMPINSIEIGKRIKEKYPQALIVFISYREDFIFDALEIFPYTFIRKMNLDKELKRFFDLISISYLEIEINKEIININPLNIIYIERIGHYSYIKIKDQFLKTKLSLKWYQEHLDEHLFEYSSQSYLINVRQIKKEEKDGVIMNDNKKLYYSRHRRNAVRKKYIYEKMK